MGDRDMKIRAVIFDIYATLLQVGAPPANADTLWQELFHATFQTEPPLGRLEFSVACNRAIMLRHNSARARGVAFPEVVWPSIVGEVLPAFNKLKPEQQTEFIFRQIQIGRTIGLMRGASETLRWLANKHCPLGLASNAQAYTLQELDNLLKTEGGDLKLFELDLRYMSYQFGFSKPDPHGFQMLRARLEMRGISPNETLMVGDRLDNDVTPARLQGFQTWHLKAESPEKNSGDWSKLRAFLVRSV
jgi:FMN phosphatase YigB (HAD superfamily)